MKNKTKRSKEKITVLLCTNDDGNDKRKSLMIGKYNKLRCFENFNVNIFVDHQTNTNT